MDNRREEKGSGERKMIVGRINESGGWREGRESVEEEELGEGMGGREEQNYNGERICNIVSSIGRLLLAE